MLHDTARSRHRRSRMLGAVAIVVLALVAVACVPPPPQPALYDAACQGALVATTPGAVASSEVDELSGIVASRRNAGVWWVHNDSGNSAKVYAVGDDGRDLGGFTLSPAANVDWEDIAVGPGPMPGTHYLYVGDIGDYSSQDGSTRPSVAVYRVPEPAVDAATAGPGTATLSDVARLSLVYPGGARYDAEALLVDPATGELYVITKSWAVDVPALVFRAPADLAAGSTTTLTQVATLPYPLITGADVSVAGDLIALRTYFSVLLFPRPTGSPLPDAFAQPMCVGAAPADWVNQYEAVGFTSDGRAYVTVSEGVNPPLRRYSAP